MRCQDQRHGIPFEWWGSPTKAARPMSKSVLGRGLGTLLHGTRIPHSDASPPPASGVQLLLRGTDGSELLPPAEPIADQPSPAGFPSWALGLMLVGDAILLLVAWWMVWWYTGWGRFAAAGLLVLVGGSWLCLAVWLRGQPAVQELQSMNPLAEDKPRLRVRFLDEQPPRR